MAVHDSVLEQDPENFNLLTLIIKKERDNNSRKRHNKAGVWGKIMEARQGLNKISHIVNPTKRGGGSRYTPVIRILLDSGAGSLMVLEQ